MDGLEEQAKLIEQEQAGTFSGPLKNWVRLARLDELADEIAMLELSFEDLPDTAPQEKLQGARKFVDYRPKGASEKERLDSLHAFAQAYPELVEITIKRQAVLDAIKSETFARSRFPEDLPRKDGDLPHPPGLELFWNVSTVIR